MGFQFRPHERFALPLALVKWSLLGAVVGALSGSASALFLMALARATALQTSHPLLLWGLPFAGIAIAIVYAQYGKSVEAGSNLLLERIHNPGAAIPFRMAPLVLISTVVTHLFGGSAGREGTAVQMGGTLAGLLQRPLRLSPSDYRLLIMSGISAGFGSVFGTPLAGTLFGLEVLTVGRMSYEALIPCFVASMVGDLVCRAWGVSHPVYRVPLMPTWNVWTGALVLLVGALSAGASSAFIELTHAVGRFAKSRLQRPWMRPFVGGCLVIGLTYLCGTRAYLGLSLPLIAQSFTPEGVFWGAFALKILFTAITLGTGFKGGEVTPLFCIGATLGAAVAKATGQPTAFFAALGFVAVFAGAANTPFTCIVMGIELFGGATTVPVAAACIVCYTLSGHRGIYGAQMVHTPKAERAWIPERLRYQQRRVNAGQADAAEQKEPSASEQTGRSPSEDRSVSD